MPVSLNKTPVPDGFTRVKTSQCYGCGESGTVDLPNDGLVAYNKGALIQVAFPNVHPDIREQFQSGFHPQCWNAMFGEPEDHR